MGPFAKNTRAKCHVPPSHIHAGTRLLSAVRCLGRHPEPTDGTHVDRRHQHRDLSRSCNPKAGQRARVFLEALDLVFRGGGTPRPRRTLRSGVFQRSPSTQRTRPDVRESRVDEGCPTGVKESKGRRGSILKKLKKTIDVFVNDLRVLTYALPKTPKTLFVDGGLESFDGWSTKDPTHTHTSAARPALPPKTNSKHCYY